MKGGLFKRQAKDAEREFSCILAPVEGPLRERILQAGKSIPVEDIYDPPSEEKYGLEDKPHVTILFGLHTQDATEVKDLLEDVKLLKGRLDGYSLFTRPEKPYDVLKLDVNSEALHTLHDELKSSFKNTESFSDYHPHLTIAYLKKGRGVDYSGGSEWAEKHSKGVVGEDVAFGRIQFSDKHATKTDIRLHADLYNSNLISDSDFTIGDHVRDKEISDKFEVVGVDPITNEVVLRNSAGFYLSLPKSRLAKT